MSKKLKRSAVALVLAATMLFSSQGVLTAFAAGENETSTAVDVSALEPILDKVETDVANESGNVNDDLLENVCEICGGVDGQHKEGCSANQQPENTCPVCGGVDGQHEEGCSANQQPENTCPVCGGVDGQHTEDCTANQQPDEGDSGETTCPVCGGVDGQHTEDCTANQQPDEGDSGETTCPECGGVDGQHEENCSLAQESDNTPSEEDVAAAKNVSDLIGALPEASTLDPETTDVEALTAQVKAAREAYDKLTDAQKALVEKAVLDKLVALEGALEGLEQVNTIPETDKNTVALIGEQPYNSMTEALKAVKSDQTVVLQKDISESLVLYSAGNKENVTIDLNEYTWNGGLSITHTLAADGALSVPGSTTVKNGTFSGATTLSISASGGSLKIENVAFENNSGRSILSITGGKAELSNCTFSGNTATSDAIVRISMPADTPSSITGCDFINNTAVNGTLHVTGTNSGSTTTTISGCTFTGNIGKNGGAIYVGATVEINNCNFTGNTAQYFGGAIMVSGSAANTNYEASITNSTITNNKATKSQTELTGSGGGIFVQANGRVTIDSSTVIHSNTAEYAGDDIYVRENLQASLTFSPVGEGWKLADCGHDITGWYQDTKGNRWSEDSITEEVTFDGDTLILTAAALKAAHGTIDTPVTPDPTPGEEQDWDHSKSKTATPLDANYESDVTLSLPSAEEQLESDVVFVLDKSTSTDVTNQINSMLEKLSAQVEETGASVKVGIVSFNKAATRELELTDLTTGLEQIQQKLSALTQDDGTNMHAGILAGKAMLDEDDTVSPNRKYLVFVTDGISYIYDEDSQIVPYYWLNDGSPYFSADPYSWNFKYGSNTPPDNWTAFLNTIGSIIPTEKIETVSYENKDILTASDGINASDLDQNSYTTTVDRSLYYTYEVYSEAQKAGYHCYAVNSETSAEYLWGPDFMKYLAGGQEVSFEDIQNDIFYLLDEGSSVVDVIGFGTDNAGNEYNFDFVDNLDNLKITVGGNELDKEDIIDPQFNDPYVTSAYGFGKGNEEYGYDFVLKYYQKGQDGNSDECFVWEINVPVSNFAPVQLTYTVKLTNPQTAEGTYGEYDANGKNGSTSLYTNKEATLYPVDSNGDSGVPENFPKPTVSYTVGGNDNPGTDPTPDPDPDPDRPSRPNRDDDDDWEPLPDAPVKDKPTTEVDVPEETETPTTEQPDKYNPETGDTTTVFAAMALATVSLGGVVLLGRKKK